MMEEEIQKIKTKIEKELKSGLIALLLLFIINNRKASYGYEIRKEIEKMSEGKLQFLEGVMYVSLNSMENQGLLKSYWKKSSSGGPPRKYYSLTELGEIALSISIEEWNKLVDIQQIIFKNMEE